MNGKKQIAWGVEYVRCGKKTVMVDPAKNKTAQDAKKAFATKRGISWEECERKGAKVIKREMAVSQN